jgi:hypothetical protein
MEYTYTIRFKLTNQKYHGCKYGKDANSLEFFKSYFTSSKIVKNLIKEHGIDAFEILDITEYPNGGAYEAESKFLLENDCANSDEWLNKSNNDYNLPHSSDIVKSRMLAKYGVEHNMQLESTKEKISIAAKNNWKNEEYRNKIKNTFLENYGYSNPNKSEEIKNKIKNTNLEKYGVENVYQSEEIKNKIKNTFLENYGMHPKQTEKVKEKCKKNSIEKYGVDHYAKTDEFKNKIRTTWNNKSQEELDIFKNKSKKARENDPILECPHCHKLIKNKGLFNRWHNDNCKEYKNK